MAYELSLSASELVGLCLLLREHEASLDEVALGLLARIERRLYELLSVEEMENLAGLYRDQPDFLDRMT